MLTKDSTLSIISTLWVLLGAHSVRSVGLLGSVSAGWLSSRALISPTSASSRTIVSRHLPLRPSSGWRIMSGVQERIFLRLRESSPNQSAGP